MSFSPLPLPINAFIGRTVRVATGPGPTRTPAFMAAKVTAIVACGPSSASETSNEFPSAFDTAPFPFTCTGRMVPTPTKTKVIWRRNTRNMPGSLASAPSVSETGPEMP